MGKLALLFIISMIVYQSRMRVSSELQLNEMSNLELQPRIDYPVYLGDYFIVRRRSSLSNQPTKESEISRTAAINLFRKRASSLAHQLKTTANDIDRSRRFENGWQWNF